MVFTCQVNCLAASQGGTGGRENSEGRRRKASREDTTRADLPRGHSSRVASPLFFRGQEVFTLAANWSCSLSGPLASPSRSSLRPGPRLHHL